METFDGPSGGGAETEGDSVFGFGSFRSGEFTEGPVDPVQSGIAFLRETEQVLDSTQAGSPESELLLRTNPLTGSVASMRDVSDIASGTTPEGALRATEGLESLLSAAPEDTSLSRSFRQQFDDVPGGGIIDDVVEDARNIGPDWLDEVTGLLVTLVVLVAGLWLIRPVLEIVAGVVE